MTQIMLYSNLVSEKLSDRIFAMSRLFSFVSLLVANVNVTVFGSPFDTKWAILSVIDFLSKLKV